MTVTPEDMHDKLSHHFSEQTGDPTLCVRYILIADCVIDGQARAILMNHSEEMPPWMVRGMLNEAKEINRDFEEWEGADESSDDAADDE